METEHCGQYALSTHTVTNSIESLHLSKQNETIGRLSCGAEGKQRRSSQCAPALVFHPPAGIPNSPQCPGKLQNRSLKAGQGTEPRQNLPSFVTPMNSSTNSNSIQLPRCPNAPQTYTSSICCTQMYMRVCLVYEATPMFRGCKRTTKGTPPFWGALPNKKSTLTLLCL